MPDWRRGTVGGMTTLEPHVRRLLEWMPKAELHLHLDGSLRTNTAIELAQQYGIEAPRTWREMFHTLVAPEHPGSQAELLRAFDLPIALMQHHDALARISRELVEDKARDNVRFMEVKWAPAFHTQQGLSLDEVIRAVGDAAAEAGRRCGVEVRLNVVAIRAHTPELNVAVAEAAVRCRDAGVTGFDFAGYEAANPDPTPHAEAFDIARAGGLGINVHTGEIPDDGTLLRLALQMQPDRISHGVSVANDPSLVAQLAAERLTLDLCPTSNVQANAVPSLELHPLPMLLRAGVPVTINTDDLTVSDITLSEEYGRCITHLGLTLPEIWSCNLHALRVAFVDEPTRARLLAEFEAWARHLPDLHA